ncbi:N-acetylmuramoyl-L-alanine amidase [Solwaraspora sp. WMMD1047]|uniref:peptidoglycan recognition protein family protein n=1 Tax=Solwaraspora sp. WMMD1047 TaxID=3016102 RepID=UPI002415E2C1|nr:N-acetylmuramoyl-L-alanine amidase [Solwaraspora sp. WMMD1047]MDG4831945.1 N-acetylmuramoyl-L-alanine amidase [Solwaraspora sp. WMMD1047]
MRILWFVEVLRAAGLTVHEVDGWRTRGSATFEPRGIMVHETRGSLRSTDAGEIRVLLNGSTTAPPPIAQLYLSRSGQWWVVASGRCNHVLTGWAGPFKGVGNGGLLGIEAQHALGEPWTENQYRSYVRGVAALRQRTGWAVAGHKEHQPGGYGNPSVKTDPSFNMDQFRRDVAGRLTGTESIMPALTEAQQEQLLRYAKDNYYILWQGAQKPDGSGRTDFRQYFQDLRQDLQDLRQELQALQALLSEVRAGQRELAGRDWVDERQIIDGVLAGLGSRDLDEVASALRAVFGERAAELGARLVGVPR